MEDHKRKRRILVVDDEESVGLGVSEMLKDAGYTAFYVTSGHAAVKAVSEGDYSLIFMDMIMPVMNGLDTFRQIRKINPETKVVLFTGYFKDADKTIFQGVKEGMIDVSIRKPFFAEEIINTVKKYA